MRKRVIVVLCLVALLWLAAGRARAESDWIGQIVAGHDVVQDFKAADDGLLAISMPIGTYKRANTCTLEMTLMEVETGRVVTDRTFACATFGNGDGFILDFPAQAHSKGRQYRLTLHSPDAKAGNAVTIPAKPAVDYQNIGLTFGGAPLDGGLYLTLVYGQNIAAGLPFVALCFVFFGAVYAAVRMRQGKRAG